MCICLWPEFDCPEVSLCGWQDINIQLLLLLWCSWFSMGWSFWLHDCGAVQYSVLSTALVNFFLLQACGYSGWSDELCFIIYLNNLPHKNICIFTVHRVKRKKRTVSYPHTARRKDALGSVWVICPCYRTSAWVDLSCNRPVDTVYNIMCLVQRGLMNFSCYTDL